MYMIFSGLFGPKGYENMNVSEAREAIKENRGLLLLDVRTPAEFRTAYIRGAMLVPISVLPAKLSELEAHKDSVVIVYCAVGGRSASASKFLASQGFSNVFNMSGGIEAWKRQGFEIEKN